MNKDRSSDRVERKATGTDKHSRSVDAASVDPSQDENLAKIQDLHHMPLYIISCALRDLKHDYKPFWNALEMAGARRAMEAVWLLDAPKDSLETLTAGVLTHLMESDRLLVAEIGKWSATRLLDDTGVWLKQHAP